MTYFHIFLPTMFSVRALRCVLTQPTRAISSKSIEMYTHKKNEYKQRPDPIRLYRTLNLPVNASTQDIKNCYYELAKKYHPDANRSSSEAYEKFQEINEAYEVLSDQKKRFNYDRFGIVPREKELTKKSTENGTFDKFYKIMRRYVFERANLR